MPWLERKARREGYCDRVPSLKPVRMLMSILIENIEGREGITCECFVACYGEERE